MKPAAITKTSQQITHERQAEHMASGPKYLAAQLTMGALPPFWGFETFGGGNLQIEATDNNKFSAI